MRVPARLPGAPQTFDNKSVFRAVLFAELDFTSPPWDMLSGALPCAAMGRCLWACPRRQSRAKDSGGAQAAACPLECMLRLACALSARAYSTTCVDSCAAPLTVPRAVHPCLSPSTSHPRTRCRRCPRLCAVVLESGREAAADCRAAAGASLAPGRPGSLRRAC